MTVSNEQTPPKQGPCAEGAAADPASALVPFAVFSAAAISQTEPGAVGRFPGSALFLDVTGFTTLSERLGRQGSAGTEELVRILNEFFEPVIDVVRSSGGEVVAFGGDAVTAVWSGEGSHIVAATCGERLAALARARGRIHTSIGEVAFAVRIGVAAGMVDVAVGGRSDRLMMLTQGEAVDRAVACEHEADPGTVVARDPDGRAIEQSEEERSSTEARPNESSVSLDPARFAHPVIVERVRRGDTTLLDGHRRVTTVFCHIPDTGSPVDPASLESLPIAIGKILESAVDLGGEVIQVTGGDKGTVALLTFGAPTSCPDDAVRAVATAMRLTRELPGAEVGVGTGTVFAGLVGGPTRSVYTVMGDSVTLSARLMQRAEPGTVVVDATTAAAADANFIFDGWETVALKGKDERVRVARLAGQRGRLWPTNRLATDGPMLGRTEELLTAERALETRRSGVRRVLIRGAAGIGKSRFGRALTDRATARGWHVVAGGFAAFADAAPYSGWQPVLRSILGAQNSPETGLERLLRDSSDLMPLLGPLVGLELPETAASAAIAGELRSELAEELAARAIEAAANERPVLIELEDWHWADPSSARLLEVLSSRAMSAPVTVAITQRLPLEGTPLPSHEGDIVVDLHELDDSTTRDLAASVLARTGRTIDADRIARLVDRGAGNPLMIESLIDVGEADVLATSLAPLLQARLDGIPDADLRPLLWVSAFGRPVVSDELDTAMADADEADAAVSVRLDRLVAGGLLTATRPTDGAPLDFRHASVREAAYERLSRSSRGRVHHGIAVAIEARDGQAIEIAQHLVWTDDLTRQLRWFPLAGGQARAAWAVEDAISWFEQARTIGDRSEDVRIGLADMLMVRGDLDRVAELVGDPCADPPLDRRRLMLTGERSLITGAGDRAVETLAEALRLARESGSSTEAVAAAELLSRALIEVGRLDEAAGVAQRIIDAVDPDDHDAMARAIGAYGTVQIHRLDLGGAVITLRRAVVEARRGEDRVRLVHLLSDLATACAMAGDAAEALEAMLSARVVAVEIGYRRHLALSVSNEAELRLLLGEDAAVTQLSLRGLRAAATLGDVGLACDNLLRLAADPDLDTADRRAILEASIPLEEDLHRPHTLIEFRTVAIEVGAREPSDVSAEEADAVLAEARELGRPDLELRVLSVLRSRADPALLADLGARLDEAGERFLLDVELRRITGDRDADDELRTRGRELYRKAPYATYRAALSELGVSDPPTDVIVPARASEDAEERYSLRSVLDLIEKLRTLIRRAA